MNPKGDIQSLDMLESEHVDYNLDGKFQVFNYSQSDMILDGSAVIIPGLRTNLKGEPCRLCILTKIHIKTVYYLCSEFVIISCPVCEIPIASLRIHTMNITPSIISKIISKATEIFHVDPRFYKNTEVDHLNWHIISSDDQIEEIDRQHVVMR
jgi:hypothetical protein